jgi:hypothetical protein
LNRLNGGIEEPFIEPSRRGRRGAIVVSLNRRSGGVEVPFYLLTLTTGFNEDNCLSNHFFIEFVSYLGFLSYVRESGCCDKFPYFMTI